MDNDNPSDDDNSSINEGKRRTKKLDIIKRMVRGHRKKKRAKNRETFRQRYTLEGFAIVII